MQAKKILTIGIDYRVVRGGVAAVENVYSTFYTPFNHVSTVVAYGQIRKMWTVLKAFVTFLAWMVFRHEIKIVHVHGASDASFWRKRIFIRMAKFFGKKVVFHCHGSEFQRFYAQHPEAVKATLLHCDCIIALSQSWKQWFENAIHHPNVVVIKNVIPSPHIHKVKQDTFTLLFLGRLGKRKGTYDMMEILAEHKNEFEGKLQFLYGGDGDVEQITNFVKEHQLDNIAKYQGWVDGEKKIELLNSADAYILPSYNEGLPISVLEAMSYKLPIISTTVGGTPEIVTNQINGFLTSPGDKDAIYNAISTLMNNAEMCLKQGQASFDIVQEHLPDFVAGQLTELYNSLLK